MQILDHLNKIPHIEVLRNLALKNKINVYLVGGFLRDIYLKKYSKNKTSPKNGDFDFFIEFSDSKNNSVEHFVKIFTDKISAKYIILDEKTQSYRVILNKNDLIYTYDFTIRGGANVREDLSLRDFSINMLTVNICKPKELIDCFLSRKDIEKETIRLVKEEVVINDPLRILRGFAFMARLEFSMEKNTEKFLVKHKKLLKNVSSERINEELFKILSVNNSFKVIARMDKLGILSEIIPYIDQCRKVAQGGYHHLDVWSHSLEALRQFELMYNNALIKHKEISDYLNSQLIKDHKRFCILKLACLLHDIGKPQAKKRKHKRTIFYTHEKIGSNLAKEIAFHLRLSFKEEDLLTKLIFWHLRPGYLADQDPPSKRAIYRFFRDTQEEGIGVILLALSDWRSTRGPLVKGIKRKKHERIMLSLIDKYFADKDKKPLLKLVNGYDLMRKFDLSPGELIGKILQKINEEQALGKINNQAQAFKLAKLVIRKSQETRYKK